MPNRPTLLHINSATSRYKKGTVLPRSLKAGYLHKSKVSNHDYLYLVFSQLIQDMHAGLEYSSVKIGYWYILP